MNNNLEYAKRITSSEHPLQQKLVYAFMDAMTNSTRITEALDGLRRKSVVGNEFFYPLGLSKYVRYYMTPKYQSLIAYAMKKKDNTLFEAISKQFFTGLSHLFLSEEYISHSISTTDAEQAGVEAATDMGLTTDAPEGLVYQVFINNYVEGDVEIDDIQTYAQMIAAREEVKYFISIVKPARVTVAYASAPYCKLGSPTIASSTEYNTGVSIISSPFTNSTLKTAMAHLSELELNSLYDSVSGQLAIEITPSTRSVTVTDQFVRIQMTIQATQADTTVPADLWGDFITLTTTDSALVPYDMSFKITSAVMDDSTTTRFATLSIYIPLQ